MGRMRKTGPVIQDPRLAAELRRLRLAAGKTGDELAGQLGWSVSKVSRLERAVHGISRSDLTSFLRALKVPAERGQAVFALAAAVQASRAGFPGQHFGGACRAAGVLDWAPGIVPWLLQVPAYTRAVLVSRQPAAQLSPGAMTVFCDAVAAWQSRLAAGVTLRAVISESVLYRLVGSERTMRAQLDKLARPPVPSAGVRVLAEDCGELVGYDAFTYLARPGVGELPESATVLTYQLGGMTELEADGAVWAHKLAFEALWERAEPPAAAIKRALAGAWSGE
jgi:transcriptional regulator with XRE-family HTH domain